MEGKWEPLKSIIDRGEGEPNKNRLNRACVFRHAPLRCQQMSVYAYVSVTELQC